MTSTGTASGKTLAFNLPVLNSLAADPKGRALYLYPTKALAQDQARSLAEFRLPRLRAAIYDGDTPSEQRWQVRKWANLILTNPDMLHIGVLPHHDRWGDVLQNLRYVVVDEAHVYRGVFGSHVGNVLRRLRRAAGIYGAKPQFLLASATIANPGEQARALLGLDVTVDRRRRGPARRANRRLLEPAAPRRGARRPREPARRRRADPRRARDRGPAHDLLRQEPEGGRARPPLRRRAPRRGEGRASLPVPGRVHARAAARDRAAPGRGRAPRRDRDGRARARDRHRPPRRRHLGRLPRDGREPAPAVGPGRPAEPRPRRARRERGRARPVLHARAGSPDGPARRGGDPRPRERAHPRRPCPRGRLRGPARRARRRAPRAGGARARRRPRRGGRPAQDEGRATSGPDASTRPPRSRSARRARTRSR